MERALCYMEIKRKSLVLMKPRYQDHPTIHPIKARTKKKTTLNGPISSSTFASCDQTIKLIKALYKKLIYQ